MYLHQQISDLLLLQARNKFTKKLESEYVKSIQTNVEVVRCWYAFRHKPNNLYKLRFQSLYRFNDHLLSYLKFNYIKGSTYFDSGALTISICNNNIDMVRDCISHDVIPDVDDLENAVQYIEIFRLLLEYVKPIQSTIDAAVYNDDSEVFDICISLGLKPSKALIILALNSDNLKLFRLCIKYGIKVSQDLMHKLVINKQIEMYKACIADGMIPYTKTLSILGKM